MIMAINVEPDSRTLSSSVAWPWKSHYTLLSMSESRIFRQGGGGPGQSDKKSPSLYPIETHTTCDFPGGSGPPDPPLDPHLLS